MRPLIVGWGFAVINYFLFYIIGIIIARWFGAADFGDYSVAVAILTLFGIAATLGLGKSSLNVLSVYREKNEWNLYHGYLRISLLLILVVSVLMGIAFLGGFSLYEKYVGTIKTHPVYLLAVYFIPAAGLVFFLSQVLIANNKFIYSVIIQRFQLPIQVLALIILFHYLIPDITIEHIVIAFGLSWVLCTISSLFVVLATHDRQILKSSPKYMTKSWLQNAYPFLFNTLVLNALGASTLILLEILHVSESDIGIYAAASRSAILLIVLMKQGDRFFLPQISISIDKNELGEINKILRTRFKYLGLISLAFFIAIVIFGKNILELFGEGFSKGYVILLIFTAGIIIDILAGISASILQILGKNSLSLKVTFLILLSNIVLNIIFIPIWGLEAAVIAVNISIAAINAFAVLYLMKNHNIRVI